jgi:hypothetical protein
MTNRRASPAFLSIPEPAFDLELFTADPVRLIPVDLGTTYRTILQPHSRDPLALAPPPLTIISHETAELPDPAALGDRTEGADRAKDLELHVAMIGS